VAYWDSARDYIKASKLSASDKRELIDRMCKCAHDREVAKKKEAHCLHIEKYADLDQCPFENPIPPHNHELFPIN